MNRAFSAPDELGGLNPGRCPWAGMSAAVGVRHRSEPRSSIGHLSPRSSNSTGWNMWVMTSPPEERVGATRSARQGESSWRVVVINLLSKCARRPKLSPHCYEKNRFAGSDFHVGSDPEPG